MAAQPCYSGPNPVTDEERAVIWKWAKEHGGVDDGANFHATANAINQQFFSGMAKPEWIDDILSGRKTPFRRVANDLWKKQYNRRVVQQQAKEIRHLATLGPAGRILRTLWTVPRSVAVAGHGIVFPVTHAGDLVFRPASWGTFIKGTLRTYRGALVPTRFGGGKGYTGRILNAMERDAMFDTALRSGLDAGKGSHPSGLISRTYHGPAQRAWDMLTVMRFELWKKQMGKFVKTGMSEAEVLDIGQNLAKWANHATGSGKGPAASLGGEVLFGPKLTQSKLNRLIGDPIQTANTFANWKTATAGEKAAAWTRLSGSTQWLVTNLGFLAVNQGLLYAFGSKDKVNYTNPMKGDWMAFKVPGMHGYVPGLHTEVRTLAKILAIAFSSRKERMGQTKFAATAKTIGQYGMAKLMPTIQRGLEIGFGEDWQGRPLPWSKEPGTPSYPRMTYGEYAADIGPIPTSGPIGFVIDQLKKSGASSLDAITITKALIIFGIGAPGFHISEEHPPKPAKGGVAEQIKKLQKGGSKRQKTQAEQIKELLQKGP
jgi:hypothetical protein